MRYSNELLKTTRSIARMMGTILMVVIIMMMTVVTKTLIGTLRNHDGNALKNVRWKHI